MTQNRDVAGTVEKFESSSPHHFSSNKSGQLGRGCADGTPGYTGDTRAEKWAPCPGHPRFEISDQGRVRRTDTGRIMAQSTLNGYKKVCLWSGEMMVSSIVHRLVALAFIPNDRSEADCVNHIDCNKGNNAVENLEWCTQAENIAHAKGLGLMPRGEAHGRSKLNAEAARAIRAMRDSGATLDAIASKFGVTNSTVHQIVSGRTWIHALSPAPTGDK